MEPIRHLPRVVGGGHFAGLLAGPWLSRQPPAFSQCVLDVGRRAFFGCKDMVSFEGDEDRRIFGIVSGSIGCLTTHRQNMPVLGTIIGPGQWFGMGPQLTGTGRILSFVAREPSELVSLGDAELGRLREAFPDLPDRIAQLAQLQSNHIVGLVAELLVPKTERRIAAVLLRLCEPGAGRDTLPVSQSELGEMANASRASVNRTLGMFAQRGLLEIGYGRITVQDRAGLEAWFETSRTSA